MAQNDFLLVTDENWVDATQYVPAIAVITSEAAIQEYIGGHDWGTLSDLLVEVGVIPDGTIVSDARLVNLSGAEGDFMFWYRLP